MSDLWNQARDRAMVYAQKRGRVLCDELGSGYDGIVFATNRATAVKALRYEELYRRERDVYIRLRDRNVEFVEGFRVPALIGYDDQLWIVEMEFVTPPFVVDFAGAYLDERPQFPAEVYSDWQQEKIDQYGADWPLVQSVMAGFARLGIYLGDVKPGNITLQ
ncbi:MAG: hypothetical protein KF861_05185 [Planctomycetaceae bacterium]|nr:hypothetical protein [Planctomycetaceae bacterium]